MDRTAARLRALGVDIAALARLRLAAVGPATAERLARIVREPDLVPNEAKGDVLARALAPHVQTPGALPSSRRQAPQTVAGLLAAGAELTAVGAYRTVPAPASEIAPLAGGSRAATSTRSCSPRPLRCARS